MLLYFTLTIGLFFYYVYFSSLLLNSFKTSISYPICSIWRLLLHLPTKLISACSVLYSSLPNLFIGCPFPFLCTMYLNFFPFKIIISNPISYILTLLLDISTRFTWCRTPFNFDPLHILYLSSKIIIINLICSFLSYFGSFLLDLLQLAPSYILNSPILFIRYPPSHSPFFMTLSFNSVCFLRPLFLTLSICFILTYC